MSYNFPQSQQIVDPIRHLTMDYKFFQPQQIDDPIRHLPHSQVIDLSNDSDHDSDQENEFQEDMETSEDPQKFLTPDFDRCVSPLTIPGAPMKKRSVILENGAVISSSNENAARLWEQSIIRDIVKSGVPKMEDQNSSVLGKRDSDSEDELTLKVPVARLSKTKRIAAKKAIACPEPQLLAEVIDLVTDFVNCASCNNATDFTGDLDMLAWSIYNVFKAKYKWLIDYDVACEAIDNA